MISGPSNIAEEVNSAFLVILIACVALLVFITVLMIFFVVKYRRSKGVKAQDIPGHTVLEIVWTIVPTLLVLGMFYFGWVGYKFIVDIPKGAMEVRVQARMWSWMFEYTNGVQSDVLRVPVGRPVKLELESTDVLHSFFVPAFKVKKDVVPGLKNEMWFAPPDTGTYDILCAEYCGERHSYMYSQVIVMEEKDFEEWLELEKKEFADEVTPGDEAGTKQVKTSKRGKRLVRTLGCVACHSQDGTKLVGPTFKGLFGTERIVITDGNERTIVADEAYIRSSILEPAADITKGYKNLMPPQKVTDDELQYLIEYLKSL